MINQFRLQCFGDSQRQNNPNYERGSKSICESRKDSTPYSDLSEFKKYVYLVFKLILFKIQPNISQKDACS